MRDSGEHFPAFNLAIRHHGVKKSGKFDFPAVNYARKCCSRRATGCDGEFLT